MKYAVRALLVFFVLMVIIGGRVLHLQRSHFLMAEEHYKNSDFKLAIREYETAMHFYAPFSPYMEKSAKRLWQMAEMFERQDKPEWSHRAYSAIRSSFYGSRSLFTPGKDWIEKCTDRLIDLNIKMLLKEGSIKPEDADAERAKHRFTLTVDRAPLPLWSLLSALGFMGWVASTALIIFKGFDKDGRVYKRPLLYGGASFVFFFSLWIIALWKA